MFDNALNVVFSPMLGLNPALSIFLMGFLISTITSLLNKKFLGAGEAKEIKERSQEVREKLLKAQKAKDTNAINKHLSELMKINSEYFRFMIKPMLVSFALIILILPWLRSNYSGMTVAVVPTAMPLVGGFEMSWIWWYFISALTVSLTLKKVLGI